VNLVELINFDLGLPRSWCNYS